MNNCLYNQIRLNETDENRLNLHVCSTGASACGGNPSNPSIPVMIDALVYELYGLTEEEVKVVEGEK